MSEESRILFNAVKEGQEVLASKLDALQVSQAKVEGAVSGHTESIFSLETRFDKLETKVDNLETRFDTLETKVDNLETRFDTLETKVDNLETRFDTLETKVDNLEVRMEKVEERLDRVEVKLDNLTDSVGHLNHNIEKILAVVSDHSEQFRLFTTIFNRQQDDIDYLKRIK